MGQRFSIYVLYKIVCPEICKTCKVVIGVSDEGKYVTTEGICEYFCSIWGYCGNGTGYESGDDCSSCKLGKQYIVYAIPY